GTASGTANNPTTTTKGAPPGRLLPLLFYLLPTSTYTVSHTSSSHEHKHSPPAHHPAEASPCKHGSFSCTGPGNSPNSTPGSASAAPPAPRPARNHHSRCPTSGAQKVKSPENETESS